MFSLFFSDDKAEGGERLRLIAERAKEIYARKKGKKTRKAWNNAQRQAAEELKEEGLI